MTSLFATGFGIYKMMYAGISDIAFGEMFSGGIAAAVQAFKTTGSGMAESISRLGAIATTAKIPLEEQLAILGMLQATMPGSEAGTKYKAFMKSAAKAGGELGLQFTDSNNQLLGMVNILKILRDKYGETLDAMEKQEIQKAFGRVEAVEVVDLFYDRIGGLAGNIENMNQAMKNGTTLTQKMAKAMNIDIGSQLKLVRQQLHNLFEILGNTLLPIITPITKGISGIILTAQRLAKVFPGVTKVVLGTTLAIGGLLVTSGMLLMGLGAMGLAIPAANTALAAFGITATITGASIKAALLSAFWPVTIGIAVIYALKKAWDNNLGGIQDKVAAFWHTVSTIWNGISSLISSGKVSEALHRELQNMGLWPFVKSIYMVYHRLSQFFGGVYQQIKSAFSALGEAFYPIFSAIYRIVAPVGKILFSLAQALGLVGSAIPSGVPEWTDHNDSDFGIVLLQLFSYTGDILHFYLDRMLNEAFLATVYGRENLISLLKLIDYKLAGAVPATANLIFTLGQAYADEVIILAGTECQSLGDEVIYFETDADLIIPADQLSGEVGATEGQSGEEVLANSDGTAYQKFLINASPIIDGTLVLNCIS